MPRKGKSLAAGRKSRYAKKTRRNKRSKKSKGMSMKARPNQFTPYTYIYKTLPNVMVNTIVGQAPNPAAADYGLIIRTINSLTGSSALPLNGQTIVQAVGGPATSGTFSQMRPAVSGFADYWDVGLACSFKLNDLTNYTAFANQYDSYRINKVTCTIEYLSNTANVNGSGLLPTIYIYNDQDSATPPATLSAVVGASGVRQIQLANRMKTTIKHSCVPRILVDSQASASIVGKPNQWLDCTDVAIDHHAMKFYLTDLFVPPASSTQTTCFKFTFHYHVQFRGPLALL